MYRSLACWDCGFESHRGHGCFVCCECCVLLGRGLCDELIIRPEESCRMWCVVVCDLESSWMRRPWSTGGLLPPPPKKNNVYLSQWPRGQRRGSAVARLLGLWVRIPPGAWMFVCCECCVCWQVDVSASAWSLFQRSPTELGVSEFDHEPSIISRPWPTGAVAPW